MTLDPSQIAARWQRLQAWAGEIKDPELRAQQLAEWRRMFEAEHPASPQDYAFAAAQRGWGDDVPPPASPADYGLDDGPFEAPPGNYELVDDPQKSRAEISGGGGQGGSGQLRATEFVWREEADIPPRRWLYGTHLIRGFVSATIAPGGVGKSSVKVGEALAMTCDRAIYGQALPEGPLSVWLFNLEDPNEETERRVRAAANRFGLGPGDMKRRLYMDSGRETPCVIAEDLASGTKIVRPVVETLVKEITSKEIDVLIIDPFVSSHRVNENDNNAIDMVVKEWGRIAGACNIAIELVHHARKGNGAEVTIDSARGAVALIAGVRSAIVYNRMTEQEAKDQSIDARDRGFFFSTENGKANLAPPGGRVWFRMNEEVLANGDRVGVACPWEWKDIWRDVNKATLRDIQIAVDAGGPWRLISSAQDWVGAAVAHVLDVDKKDQAKRITGLVSDFLETGILEEYESKTDARQVKRFVRVGRWISEAEAQAAGANPMGSK